MIVISGTNGIDMNGAALIGASQIDSVFINENGVSVATDTEVSSAVASGVAPKANTADLKEIGVGQTWQDLTASRALGTTYTNSTGKPITISVSILWYNNNANYDYITVNGVIVAKLGTDNSSTTTSISQLIAVVPDGGTYSVTALRPFKHWAELR